jgi:hypothetical protein
VQRSPLHFWRGRVTRHCCRPVLAQQCCHHLPSSVSINGVVLQGVRTCQCDGSTFSCIFLVVLLLLYFLCTSVQSIQMLSDRRSLETEVSHKCPCTRSPSLHWLCQSLNHAEDDGVSVLLGVPTSEGLQCDGHTPGLLHHLVQCFHTLEVISNLRQTFIWDKHFIRNGIGLYWKNVTLTEHTDSDTPCSRSGTHYRKYSEKLTSADASVGVTLRQPGPFGSYLGLLCEVKKKNVSSAWSLCVLWASKHRE